jgi:hypothetical protein
MKFFICISKIRVNYGKCKLKNSVEFKDRMLDEFIK